MAIMKKSKSGSKGAAAKNDARAVEKYLARVPEPARSTLRKVRASIRAAAPKDATEGISYGIPAFRHSDKWLVGYAAFAKHCSFFPMSGSLSSQFKEQLKAYSTSKGTVRFPVDKPLPATLVKALVKARLKQRAQKRRDS